MFWTSLVTDQVHLPIYCLSLSLMLFAFVFLFCFVLFCFVCVCCCCCRCIYLGFNRDLRQPLSQIRVSLAVALGAGQICFFAGINATEIKVGGFSHYLNEIKDIMIEQSIEMTKILLFSLRICAGCVCHSSSYYAVFSDGRFLLDAGRGNLSLSVCCKSL